MSSFSLENTKNPGLIRPPSSIVPLISNLVSFYLTDRFLKRLILIIVLPLSLATLFVVAVCLMFRPTCKTNSGQMEKVYRVNSYYNLLCLSPTPINAKACSLLNPEDRMTRMHSQKTQFHCLLSTSLSEVLVKLSRSPFFYNLATSLVMCYNRRPHG